MKGVFYIVLALLTVYVLEHPAHLGRWITAVRAGMNGVAP